MYHEAFGSNFINIQHIWIELTMEVKLKDKKERDKKRQIYVKQNIKYIFDQHFNLQCIMKLLGRIL